MSERRLAVWPAPPAAIGAEPRGAGPRQVQAGGSEFVYLNMPRYGLAVAAEHVPVSDSSHTARQRLGAEAAASVSAGTAAGRASQ